MYNAKRVDMETGEVIDEPLFVKAYVNHLAAAKGISSLQQKVLYYLIGSMNYDNTVSITKRKRGRFLKMHNTTSQVFSNCISKLAVAGFLEIEGPGQYIINPTYFTKCNWSKTKGIISKWKFTDEGETFSHRFISNDDVVDEDGELIIEGEQ